MFSRQRGSSAGGRVRRLTEQEHGQAEAGVGPGQGIIEKRVMRTAQAPSVRRAATFGALLFALGLPGCGVHPVVPQSQGHITRDDATPAGADQIPPAVSGTPYVPPPRQRPKVPTYSVVVYEVPVKELLLSLARDTKENIDVHPGLTGLVSVNAVDETLPAILERISRQVNLRYRIEGHTIVVAPDLPFVKVYPVNYVNMVRDTTSSIAVSGQISSGTTGGGGASTTTVNSTSRNAFWETLKENIQGMLTATRQQTQSAEDRARKDEAARAAREERLAQAEAVSKAGANAPSLYSTVFGNGAAASPSNATQDVVVNASAGNIMVLATDKQHALVQQYLDQVIASSQRQVLIEATIVEVTLNRTYQGGVDWNVLSSRSALQISQQMLAGAVGAAPNFVLGTTPGSRLGDVSATLKLLETFGSTRVLSSPKMMALNNQTALLKVVDNLVYFQVQSSISQGTNNAGNLQSITTTPTTVAVGVVLSMTPQINDSGVVTLTVRPTVTRQNGVARDPNPNLSIPNDVPLIQVREMESVLQLISGQTAVLGGLMQDDVERKSNQIPGLGSLARIGELFKFRDESAKKTELIIFIRPVVVTNPSLDSPDLRHLRRFLPAAEHAGDKP